MKLNNKESNLFSVYLLMIILPFLLFYWMMPFVSDVTLGADYQIFSINEQLELLFSVKTGSFPLYVPGYKFGHSSSALTLGQLYHPISHIASLLPGYWKGGALEWNTFLRLLSLGFLQTVLFAFLKKIRVNTLFSFLISFITVYNMRMLEAFRYGASLEAYTAHILLCALIGWYFIAPSRWFGPLSITGATYLLVCSGHPPMMFYGMAGAVIFALVSPFFIATMLPEKSVNFRVAFKFWIKTGACMCLGILLSSAYLVPFYLEFVATNIEYAHQGIQSHMGQDSFVGALNNFFIPLLSDILSAFGGSSLILIALLLPLLRFLRVKIPRVIWVIWFILSGILLYILGPQTPLLRWAWGYVPFVSSAGGVGRIAIIAPVLLMMLMAWVSNAAPISVRIKSLSIQLPPYAFLGIIAMILIPVYLMLIFFLKPALGYFTPHFVRKIPLWIEILTALLGMISLASFTFYGIFPRLSRLLGTLLTMMVILQTGTVLRYGTFIEKKIHKPTFEEIRLQKQKKIDFHYHQNPSLFHSAVLNHIGRSFIEPFLGKIFTEVIPVSSQEDAYGSMERNRLPQQIFVERYDPEKAYYMTEKGKNIKQGSVSVLYSSFNRLQFKVATQYPAFFGISYPFTGHWRAWVNGEKVQIYRANGAAQAVEVPGGESVVEFRYWSDAFFWGMFISCISFAIIGFVVCLQGLNGLPRITCITLVALISSGVFMVWYDSLYDGDNLETEYTWTYSPPLGTPNLAYGKKTPSYYHDDSSILRYHSGSVVDGNTERDSGVTIRPLNEAFIIDLNKLREIKTIVLYGKFKAYPEISLSEDNREWQKVSYEKSIDYTKVPLRILFGKERSSRFIKIEAMDYDIGIDELEVYGPDKVQ